MGSAAGGVGIFGGFADRADCPYSARMLGASTVLVSVPSTPPPRPPNRPLTHAMTLFWFALALGLALLGVAVVVLRRQHYRMGKSADLHQQLKESKARKKGKPDPWVEAGKRLDPGAAATNESDTVDFDPRELMPEDIEPPDDTPPQNGHGKHGGGGSGGKS